MSEPHEFYRKATVYCDDCKQNFESDKVEFLNIEEDFQGHDVMTFICPICKQEKKSHVRG